MKSRRVGILVTAVVLFVDASRVLAVIEFNDGGVHDIDYEINDNVRVDYQSPGMGTTVNILEGGEITTYHYLHGFEDSIINIVDGATRQVRAFDSSKVTVSGGYTSALHAEDSSQVTVSGGRIVEFYIYGSSQVDVSGGHSEKSCWFGTMQF